MLWVNWARWTRTSTINIKLVSELFQSLPRTFTYTILYLESIPTHHCSNSPTATFIISVDHDTYAAAAGSKSAAISDSSINEPKSLPAQERVLQGGVSTHKPNYTWIDWNGLQRSFHWRRSRPCHDRRQHQPRNRRGMENPVKEPIDGWLQLAVKTALWLRCASCASGIDRYVDFTIHLILTIWLTTLCKGHGWWPRNSNTSTICAFGGSAWYIDTRRCDTNIDRSHKTFVQSCQWLYIKKF